MRRLQVRWMIEGPGGWVERRATLPLPSLTTVLLVLALIIYALEITHGLGRISPRSIL